MGINTWSVMIHKSNIHIRDPFVVPMPEERKYYIYGTTDPDCWRPPGIGFDAYSSKNLEDWEGPYEAFRPEPGFWADRNFWAPEVHRHNGRYFMFASFKAEDVCRGTQVLVADDLKGPFRLHSDGPVTPKDWECLDGTLYVDDDGDPWMVFCHEWVQVGDGEMCAMRLTRELDKAAGEPIRLFYASDAPWVSDYPEKSQFVTDGPFIYRAENGELLMLWSSFHRRRYAQGVARSSSGEITGPWRQDPEPLYAEDGGHGMLFRTFEGRLMLTLHTPNDFTLERPLFLPIRELDGRLAIG